MLNFRVEYRQRTVELVVEEARTVGRCSSDKSWTCSHRFFFFFLFFSICLIHFLYINVTHRWNQTNPWDRTCSSCVQNAAEGMEEWRCVWQCKLTHCVEGNGRNQTIETADHGCTFCLLELKCQYSTCTPVHLHLLNSKLSRCEKRWHVNVYLGFSVVRDLINSKMWLFSLTHGLYLLYSKPPPEGSTFERFVFVHTTSELEADKGSYSSVSCPESETFILQNLTVRPTLSTLHFCLF